MEIHACMKLNMVENQKNWKEFCKKDDFYLKKKNNLEPKLTEFNDLKS